MGKSITYSPGSFIMVHVHIYIATCSLINVLAFHTNSIPDLHLQNFNIFLMLKY